MLNPVPSPKSSTSSREANSVFTSHHSLLLISYFRSGWAFFIPYLAAYLLYAWLKWPVNPPDGFGSPSGGENLSPPSLIHVYWTLHAAHIILGAIALRSWWRRRYLNPQFGLGFWSQVLGLWPLLPWLCLAFVVCIPGLYLEWPADPWEHLRRITAWHAFDTVTEHPFWRKSSYFLPYSFVFRADDAGLLRWINAYQTFVALLLSWQYYRLARAVGLAESTSFCFVVIMTLTFGNGIFSFHRYYGLSSSVVAQIGAVALLGLAIKEFGTGDASAASNTAPLRSPLLRHSGAPLAAGIALILWIGFNHIQGLALAGMGVLAVVACRLFTSKRLTLALVFGAILVASAALVLLFPRHPELDATYRPHGWLTVWYGFNFFALSSPVLTHSFQILGVFGITSIPFALWLLIRRNHVVGWLTVTPLFVVASPLFALPFAHLVATYSAPENVVTFQRMLLAAPTGLSVLVCISLSRSPACEPTLFRGRLSSPWAGTRSQCFSFRHAGTLLAGVLFLVLTLPPLPTFNRFWHSLAVFPSDLQLEDLHEQFSHDTLDVLGAADPEQQLVSTAPVAFVASIRGVSNLITTWRITQVAGAELQKQQIATIALAEKSGARTVIVPPKPLELYSARSSAGYMSRHWGANDLPIQQAGAPEFETAVRLHGARKVDAGGARLYFQNRPAATSH